ncbi:hypothetical protein [Oceanithermus sp.]
MPQIERLIIEALTDYVSPTAAQNIYDRALRRSAVNPDALDAAGWLQFVTGPLLEELRNILPIREPTGSLRRLVRTLEESAQKEAAAQPAPRPARRGPPTIDAPRLQIDLSDPAARERLASSLAREEGVSGVLLQGPDYQEARLPGVEDLVPILAVVNSLLQKQKPYKIFYSVFGDGHVLIRPLGPALVAVVAKRQANLGRLMHVLNSYEAKGGQS